LTTLGIDDVACAVVNDSEELTVHAIQARLQQLPRPFLLDVR
jgi:hypothetical protein